MTKSGKIIIVVGLLGVAAGLTHFRRSSQTESKKRKKVADEGYETAYDVLFPGKKRNKRKEIF